jgi:hypothetical protein
VTTCTGKWFVCASDNNMVYALSRFLFSSCEKCNKLRNGVKFSRVLALPEILCVHLKRFRHDLSYSSKISSAVNFPLTGLNMQPYLHPGKNVISRVSLFSNLFLLPSKIVNLKYPIMTCRRLFVITAISEVVITLVLPDMNLRENGLNMMIN